MTTKERAKQRAEARKSSVRWKLVEGDNTFRILPTPASETTPDTFYEYAIHREVGPRKRMVRCGKDMDGKGKCWLCDVYTPKLKKSGASPVRVAALLPKDEFVIQVGVINDDGKMKGPRLFSPSKLVADQLLSSIISSKKRTYEDPVKGYNLTISRTGTGKNDTRYGIIEPDEEPSKVPPEIMKQLKPFSELQEIPTYSENKQKAAIQGRDAVEDVEEEEQVDVDDDAEDEEELEEPEEDEEPEEEEEEPAPKSHKKKPAKSHHKAKPVEEDEEELDEEDEEEEEEEPVAAKKKAAAKAAPAKSKKAAPVEEEEEDEEELEDEEDLELPEEDELDEEEEEEEDEPAPPKKSHKKKK